jgi:glycogen operon protein
MEIVADSLPPVLGVQPREGGLAVAVFSRHAERIELCLFAGDGVRETQRLALPCRDGDIHHGFLPGAGAGLRYGLRAHGPFSPRESHRFDAAKLLVDPYASLIDRPFQWRAELAAPPSAAVDTAPFVPRCIVSSQEGPEATPPAGWPGLIYELGVKSFTMRAPGVPDAIRGTLAALCEPALVEHVARLGVSHVELMPTAAWMDERHLPALGLANAWGYNPVNFFALDPRLAPGGLADLRRLCTRYTQAGIGVLLDIVFNHTAESDEHGATICLRGLDNASYYRPLPGDPSLFANDTGCGNTLACENPFVVRMMLDALRQWRACGVAGFRFDLGATLGRDATGFSEDATFFTALRQDPALAGCVLIMEPWDIGPGGYQLGSFPAPLAEWNGKFRDDIRRFWRGDAGLAGALATRLAGSADLFAERRRKPGAGINYVASHDGFTLADLVSYATKHNEANGESNRDGDGDNHSWNNGVEGASADTSVIAARHADIRALLATLFVARGTPMLSAGDEFGRTQGGNNNSYAQDNAGFWLDWPNRDRDLAAFVATLVDLRQHTTALTKDAFFSGQPREGAAPDVAWLDANAAPVANAAWQSLDTLLMLLGEEAGQGRMLLAFNRRRDPVAVTLPAPKAGQGWSLALCSRDFPQGGDPLTLPPRSVRVYREG